MKNILIISIIFSLILFLGIFRWEEDKVNDRVFIKNDRWLQQEWRVSYNLSDAEIREVPFIQERSTRDFEEFEKGAWTKRIYFTNAWRILLLITSLSAICLTAIRLREVKNRTFEG